MDERQERIISCMNAAANLYGVVSLDALREIYCRYSADKPEPLCRPLSIAEIDEILALPFPDDADLESTEHCYAPTEIDGVRYLVAKYGFCISSDQGGRPRVDEESVLDEMDDYGGIDMKWLDEDAFFLYERPEIFEANAASRKFAKFLRKEYDYGRDAADSAVRQVQGEIRFCASMSVALISARNTLRLVVRDREEFYDLVDILLPLVRNTRVWEYRGHTETELVDAGVLTGFREVDGEEVFDMFMADNNAEWTGKDGAGAGADWERGSWNAGEMSDDDLEMILPPAESVGQLDFKKVKDADWRERILVDYDNVRDVTSDFIKNVVMNELTQKERMAAVKRLGFGDGQKSFLEDMNQDMIAGDFASMMDDQSGEPAISRILNRFDKLTKYEQLGARYFRKYRYTWLVVEAVKTGFGLRCRDLLSCEELFLMEKSMSQSPEARGMTICCGIAPMGEVYFALGVISHASFESSDAVHRIVRQHLGFPLDGPLALSFGDQARFAADIIRRINALGRYGDIIYG